MALKKMMAVFVVIFSAATVMAAENSYSVRLYVNNEGYFMVKPGTQEIVRVDHIDGLDVPKNTHVTLSFSYIGPKDTPDTGNVHDFGVMDQQSGEEYFDERTGVAVGPPGDYDQEIVETISINFFAGKAGKGTFIFYCILMDCDGMDHLTDIPIHVG